MGDNSRAFMFPPMYRELRHLTQLRDTFVSEMVARSSASNRCCSLKGLAFRRLPPAGTVVVDGEGEAEKASVFEDRAF